MSKNFIAMYYFFYKKQYIKVVFVVPSGFEPLTPTLSV